MDKKVGIIREIDNLGRLVIPKEMRNLFNFEKEVEIVANRSKWPHKCKKPRIDCFHAENPGF